MLKMLWVNRAWENLTGYPAESVVGMTCQAHGPTRAGDLGDLAASFHPPPEALNGQPAGTLSLIFHASGEATWHRLEFWPFRDEQQRLTRNPGAGAPCGCSTEVPTNRKPTSSTSSYS